MEVILLEDVKSLGKKGEIVKVSDGYARNYIFKRSLARKLLPRTLMSLNCRNSMKRSLHRKNLMKPKLLQTV